MKKLKSFLAVATLVATLAAPAPARERSHPHPKPHLRFAFIGCNRIGFTELTADNPSSANRQQFLQTCDDLTANPPTYLFWIGDVVTNYAEGGEVLRGQLQPWKELYESTKLAKTPTVMVPLVGNHEVLASKQDAKGVWTDFPNPATLPVWEEILTPYLKWNDGPTTAGANPDKLTQDQSRLSFTIRRDDVLFICLNTDTFVDSKTIGDVPLHWIEDKLKQAEADPTIKHVFVLGHKPVQRPDLPGDIIRPGEDVALDALMGKCSKVRAFLTSHFHLWDSRFTDHDVYQIIAGNGGSPTSGQFNADGKGYFGYTVVELLDDGTLMIENWGRPVPKPYDSNKKQPPATLIERFPLPPRPPATP